MKFPAKQNITDLPQLQSHYLIKQLFLKSNTEAINYACYENSQYKKIGKYIHAKLYINLESIRYKEIRQLFTILRIDGRYLSEVLIKNVCCGNYILKMMKDINLQFLRRIKINRCQLGYLGVKELVRMDLKWLESLDLANNPLKNKSIQALCKANWPRLKYLDLSFCELTPSCSKTLKKSNWRHLHYWNMQSNILQSQFLKQLVKSQLNLLKYLHIQPLQRQQQRQQEQTDLNYARCYLSKLPSKSKDIFIHTSKIHLAWMIIRPNFQSQGYIHFDINRELQNRLNSSRQYSDEQLTNN